MAVRQSELSLPPRSTPRQKVLLGLRWLFGLCAVVTVLWLVFLPPRPLTPLTGWTPQCDALPFEGWVAGFLRSGEITGLDRSQLYDQSPVWVHIDGNFAAVLDLPYEKSKDSLESVLFRTVDKALMPVRPRLAGWPMLSSSWPEIHLSSFEAFDQHWLFLSDRTARPSSRSWLVRLHPDTLQEMERLPIELAFPAGIMRGHASGIAVAGKDEAGHLWLVAEVAFERSKQSWDLQLVAWQFDPRAKTISPPAVFTLPQTAPDGTPIPANQIVLLCTTGFCGHNAYDPRWGARLTAFPAGDASTDTFAVIPLREAPFWQPPAPLGYRPSGPARILSHLETTASASENHLLFAQWYDILSLSSQAHQASQILGSQPAPSVALLRNRALSGVHRLERHMRWNMGREMSSLGPLVMETTWAGVLPEDPALTASVRATLDQLHWLDRWGWEPIPVLRCYAIAPDTFLIVQLVLTTQPEEASDAAGLLRLGVLRKPDTAITWVGHVPLPDQLARYRHQWHLVCHADDTAWRFGLSAVHLTEREAELGMWWTEVPYPANYRTDFTGWLQADGRFAAAWQASQEADSFQ